MEVLPLLQPASWEFIVSLHAKGTIWTSLCSSCKFSSIWRRLLELPEAISKRSGPSCTVGNSPNMLAKLVRFLIKACACTAGLPRLLPPDWFLGCSLCYQNWAHQRLKCASHMAVTPTNSDLWKLPALACAEYIFFFTWRLTGVGTMVSAQGAKAVFGGCIASSSPLIWQEVWHDAFRIPTNP